MYAALGVCNAFRRNPTCVADLLPVQSKRHLLQYNSAAANEASAAVSNAAAASAAAAAAGGTSAIARSWLTLLEALSSDPGLMYPPRIVSPMLNTGLCSSANMRHTTSMLIHLYLLLSPLSRPTHVSCLRKQWCACSLQRKHSIQLNCGGSISSDRCCIRNMRRKCGNGSCSGRLLRGSVLCSSQC